MNLSDETRQSRNDLLKGLLVQLDHHLPSERGHAERVAVYSVATGQRLGLDDDALLNLRYAATLHDVGKIRVDRNLLTKIGKLDDTEIAAMRLHAAIAESVLESIDWLAPVLPDIRHHHERWDGEGYPDGLAGTEIPIGARIISVAETFDVMVSGPYRERALEEAAIDELRECSGSQFDPEVVEAFIKVQPLIQPIS